MARPKKDPADRYETPKRPGWRVADEDYELLRKAAEKEGKTLVGMFLPVCIEYARRVMEQKG